MTNRNMMSAIARFGTDAIGKTAEEVLQNAGLNFVVEKQPLYTKTGKTISSKFNRIARTDTDDTLGVVGRTYVPMQNQRLLGIADELVTRGVIDWDKVGMVGKGEKLFASFKLPEGFTIGDSDEIDQYIYLTNTHDGSGGIRVIPANFRIACSNQFSMMQANMQRLGINAKSLTIRHSARQEERVADLVAALNVVDMLNQQFVVDAEKLLTVEMSMDERIEFYMDTFSLKTEKELVDKVENPRGLTTRGKNTLTRLLELETAPTNNVDGMGGSAWAAFNTATEYIDHAWTYDRKGEKSNDKRVESAIIGTGARVKSKAWEALVNTYA